MFVDEALLCARIDHPNVVRVEALREHGGTWYLVMEYVAGFALSQLVDALAARGQRLEPALATAIAIAVADGLHAAHELRDEQGELLGVAPRDVSPQNVLIATGGHVKLIDFGIAKLGAGTATGSPKGKLQYMPPEQAFGRRVDRTADVYALGVVLWEMLTSRHLFDAGSELALLERVRHPRAEPPSAYAPGITPALDAAVLALLAPEPAHRPATARDVRDVRDVLARAVPGGALLDCDRLAARVREALGEPSQPTSVAAVEPAHDATIAQLGTPRFDTTLHPSPPLPPAAPAPRARPVRRAWLAAPLLAAALAAFVLARHAPAPAHPPPAPPTRVATTAPASVAPPPPLLVAAVVAPPRVIAPVAPAPVVVARPSPRDGASHPHGYHYVDGLPVSREPF